MAAFPLPDVWAVSMAPSKPRLADPGALIRSGKLRTGEFRVCLDPDLVGEYERLLLARDAAKEAAQDSLAGGAAVEAEAAIAELLEAMEKQTITLVLTALPRPKFRAMLDRHPQRKDADGKVIQQLDVVFGVDFDGFFNEYIPAAIVSPVLGEATLTMLLDEKLTDQQFIDLAVVCWGLNKSSVDVPFLPAVSRKTRNSSPK